jgi:hypothetical protein
MTTLFLEHLAINTERKLVDVLNQSIRKAGKAQSKGEITLATYWDFANQVDDLCNYCHNEWEDLPRMSEGDYSEYYMN